MAAFLSSSRPRWSAACLVVALATLSASSFAIDVLVITDSQHPIKPMGGERIIEQDQATRIEAELATGLPNDPSRAAALVQQRLRDGGHALQRRISSAYQGVADAWGLGITKVPAVVVDRRYVVYGEPDVASAVARIEAHRSTRP